MVYCLTLADLAVPNTFKHGKILEIITLSESIPNCLNVGSDVSLEMSFGTGLRALNTIALGDLCSRNQQEIYC